MEATNVRVPAFHSTFQKHVLYGPAERRHYWLLPARCDYHTAGLLTATFSQVFPEKSTVFMLIILALEAHRLFSHFTVCDIIRPRVYTIGITLIILSLEFRKCEVTLHGRLFSRFTVCDIIRPHNSNYVDYSGIGSL